MFLVYTMFFTKAPSTMQKRVWTGVCHCGHIFQFQRDVDFSKQSYISYEDVTCPVCGARYGHVDDSRYDCDTIIPEGEDGKKAMLQAVKHSLGKDRYYGKRKCMHRVETIGNDTYVISKEAIHPDIIKDCVKDESSYEITIQMHPSVRFLRILKDGQEVKVTRSTIAAALSYLTIHSMECPPKLNNELRYGASAVGSNAVPKVLLGMEKYPSISSAYNDGTPFCASYLLRDSYERGWLKPGERSPRKALGLDSALTKYCFDKKAEMVPIQRYIRSTKTKPELASFCAQMTIDVCGQSFDADLADLFSSLTTAERKRLYQYLTHETEIYQGIEDHRAAWNVLKDYRRMCVDMKITPELCPKSLKLQHDIAARNYNLCLDEILKEKFQTAVSSEAYQRLQWESEDWTVLIPNVADDIIEEGRKQCHCVGSYVRYVVDGTYRICFLRRTDNPNAPVLTLTVDSGNNLLYYKGFDNREATNEERTVLESWTKEKNLNMSQFG